MIYLAGLSLIIIYTSTRDRPCSLLLYKCLLVVYSFHSKHLLVQFGINALNCKHSSVSVPFPCSLELTFFSSLSIIFCLASLSSNFIVAFELKHDRLAIMASERLLILQPHNWALRRDHGMMLYYNKYEPLRILLQKDLISFISITFLHSIISGTTGRRFKNLAFVWHLRRKKRRRFWSHSSRSCICCGWKLRGSPWGIIS